RAASDADRRAALDQVVDLVEAAHPEVDPDWLGRFLELPFASGPDRRAALQWLSGREPDVAQLERLGLREPLPESSVLPALRTLAVVASFGAPLVIVFDQLENLVEEDGGAGRIHAHARLYCELHDTVPGLVLLQMALDSEWRARVSPALGLSERSRLEATVLTLALPTEAQRLALLDRWISTLEPDLRKPAPWPLSQASWETWRSAPGVTPRMLMIAARDALERGYDAAPEPIDIWESVPTGAGGGAPERLEDLWQEQLVHARAAL